MTDKEKLDKLVAEIERRKKMNILNENKYEEDIDLLSFYNSMQEEFEYLEEETTYCAFSTSHYTDKERKALCKGCEEECRFNKKEDSVSEDYGNALNSVAITFLQEQQIVPNFYADIIMKAVKRGANWQKEQMMKDAIKCEITWMDGFILNYTQEQQDGLLEKIGTKVGDKVKLVITKED